MMAISPELMTLDFFIEATKMLWPANETGEVPDARPTIENRRRHSARRAMRPRGSSGLSAGRRSCSCPARRPELGHRVTDDLRNGFSMHQRSSLGRWELRVKCAMRA